MSKISHALSVGARGISNAIRNRAYSISFEVTRSCNARCKHCHLRGTVTFFGGFNPRKSRVESISGFGHKDGTFGAIAVYFRLALEEVEADQSTCRGIELVV